MWCGRLLLNPPPSPALPAEGREFESHMTRFVMTINQRLHPVEGVARQRASPGELGHLLLTPIEIVLQQRTRRRGVIVQQRGVRSGLPAAREDG